MTAFGSTGQLIYERTYSRTKPDGTKEVWPETVRRVVDGNLGLVDSKYHEPGEREELISLMEDFKILPAGRHLWASGVGGRQYLYNCWVAPWPDDIAGHFEFTFLRLMEGGGVGSNYSERFLDRYYQVANAPKVHIVCDPEHPDYEKMKDVLSSEFDSSWGGAIEVEDSREGWANALTELVHDHYRQTRYPDRVFDVSRVRAEGSRLKTFGGTASGPLPLAKMLHEVNEVLSSYQRCYLDGTGAMEIDHAIAKCVVAGGNRRSARMSIMHWDDPCIVEFLTVKEETGKHWTTNISVEVDDRFWQEVGTEETHAMLVLDQIAKGMLRNGEPGIWNSSLSNVGEPNEVVCTNPCVSERTWILTDEGPRRVRDLIGKPFTAIVDGKPYASDERGFYRTGTKPVYRVTTDAGYTIDCTANQKLYDDRGNRVEVEDMSAGDRILLTDNFGVVPWDGPGDIGEGYAVGHFLGDGTFDPNGKAILASWPDQGNEPCEDRLYEVLSKMPGRSDWSGWHQAVSHRRMSKKGFTDLLETYGVVRGNKTMTDEIEKASAWFTIGVLQGLFDTDGHVEGSPTAGYSVRLSSVDYDGLQAVQRTLARFGIKSSIRDMYPGRTREMPGGVYETKASYRLIISGREFLQRFIETVGFTNWKKHEKLTKAMATYTREPYKPRMWVKLESVEYIGTEEVYDCTIPGPFDFDGNGLLIRDCGEIVLQENEPCCLGHVNLAAFIGNNGYMDIGGLMKAHRLMTRFLIRATFGDVNDPESAKVLSRNRRIGIGHFGFASAVAATGWRYSDVPRSGLWHNTLTILADTVDKAAVEYSHQLRIPVPVKKRTVAPTGTIAKLPGVSEGIHPIFAKYFIRRIRLSTVDDDQFDTANDYAARGYTVEPDQYADNTVVVEIPTKDSLMADIESRYGQQIAEGLVQSVDELSLDDMLEVQAMYQDLWADNAVSFTANVDPDRYTEGDIVSRLIAYGGALKGSTIFPETSMPQAPYERITKEEYEAATNHEVSDGIDEECASGSCPIR